MESDDDKTQSHLILTNGTLVGHYKIVNKIGAGGMGEVYLAEDTKLKRKVAIKFLSPHLCKSEDCRKRFTREARAIAKLDHSNIVTVHDVGEYDNRPYFVMQYIEGHSLKDLSQEKDLSIEKIIKLGNQICEGLTSAHENKIIHRDIKPSNILIDSNGKAMIVDFGLASIVGSNKLTKTGSTIGTINYMSPEQVEGNEVDYRSDIFSLGVVLYELITKQNPFKRDNEAATLKAVSYDTPEPLARFKHNVPELLESVITKMLEKNPAHRYQTAKDVASDLLRLINGFHANPSLLSNRKEKRRSLPLFISFITVIIIVIMLVVKPWKFEITSTNEANASANRLAIMYFENLTDPEDSLKLGEIATNLLNTDLSESEYVQVISSQRLYDILKNIGKEGQKKIDRSVATKIAKKAKARWMVLGNILKSESHIILTSQIIEVASGDAVSSQKIEGLPDEEIFPLIDRLTVELKNDLSLPHVAMEEPDKSIAEITTYSTDAYRYYLDGLDQFYNIQFQKAKLNFENAVEADSTLAMGYYYLYKIDRIKRGARQQELISKAMDLLDNASEKDRYLIQAAKHRLDGDFLSAISLYQNLINRYPDEKEGYFNMALIYKWSLGDQKTAIGLFEKTIELDSSFTEPYNQLAQDYREFGEFEKSYWAINKYISLSPESFNPYLVRGYFHYYDGNLSEAIESFLTALQKQPGVEDAIFGIGYTHLQKNNPDSAKAWFMKFIDNPDPESQSMGRMMNAHISLYLGKLQQTLNDINYAIAEDEKQKYYGAWYIHKLLLKSLLHMEKGELDSARVFSKLASESELKVMTDELLPSFIQIWIECYLDEITNAITLQQYIENSTQQVDIPALSVLHDNAGIIEYYKGNYDQAIHYFTNSLDQKKKWQFSYLLTQWMLARTFLESDRLGKAAEEFEKMLSKNAFVYFFWSYWLHKIHYYLGIAYEKSGWDSQAIEQYQVYLDLLKDADLSIKEIDDTKVRLKQLQKEL